MIGARENRKQAVEALTVALAILLLLSCHPLINPADPNSVTYSGIPTGLNPGSDSETDPEPPERALPEAEKWEIVAEHGLGRLLPLEIPVEDAPVFVEPRAAGSFFIRITLAKSFTRDDAEGALVWYAVANSTGRVIYGIGEIPDVVPEERRLYIRGDAVPVPVSNENILKIRIVDRNGVIAGERVIGILVGDVNGDGMVEIATDDAAIIEVAGYSASEEYPATIRADVDVNGIVEAGGGDSVIVGEAAAVGAALPSAIPDFWD